VTGGEAVPAPGLVKLLLSCSCPTAMPCVDALQSLVPGRALCSSVCKADGRMRRRGMPAGSSASPGSSYLTQLFFSSPTEKEATKFFSSRNGCGQVPVVFTL